LAIQRRLCQASILVGPKKTENEKEEGEIKKEMKAKQSKANDEISKHNI
jgi:hypothetical protein